MNDPALVAASAAAFAVQWAASSSGMRPRVRSASVGLQPTQHQRVPRLLSLPKGLLEPVNRRDVRMIEEARTCASR